MNVLITGVSSGLGAELPKLFLSLNHRVIGLSRQVPSSFDPGGDWTANSHFSHFPCDLETIDARNELFETIYSRYRTIDLVILNAALVEEDIADSRLDYKKCKKMMEVNYLANIELISLFCHKISPDQRITFCAISSLSALGPLNHNMVGYNASKAAISIAMQSFSAQYKNLPWRFTTVQPGMMVNEEGEYLFKVSYQNAAKKIARFLIDTNKTRLSFPISSYLIVRLVGLLPTFLQNPIISKIRNE